MELVIIVVGLVSSVVGFVDFVLSRFTKKKWWIHVIYVIFVAMFAGFASYQASQMARLRSVTRAADALIEQRTMNYTHRGFVYAVLAFLEKNRDLLPDTYARAQAACAEFRCNNPNATDMVELSFALSGLVRGIGTIEGGE